jgi:DNA-binding NtrC family response regulator
MSYRDAIKEARRQYWTALIERCNGNVSQAAREARVERKSVYAMIRRYEIQRKIVIVRQGCWNDPVS